MDELWFCGEVVAPDGLEHLEGPLARCSWPVRLWRSGYDGSYVLRSDEPGPVSLHMDAGQGSTRVFSGTMDALDRDTALGLGLLQPRMVGMPGLDGLLFTTVVTHVVSGLGLEAGDCIATADEFNHSDTLVVLFAAWASGIMAGNEWAAIMPRGDVKDRGGAASLIRIAITFSACSRRPRT